MLFVLVSSLYGGFLEQPQELNTPGSYIQYLTVLIVVPTRGTSTVFNNMQIRKLQG